MHESHLLLRRCLLHVNSSDPWATLTFVQVTSLLAGIRTMRILQNANFVHHRRDNPDTTVSGRKAPAIVITRPG